MRSTEVAPAADALADGAEFVAGMVRDVHGAVADRVFRAVARGVGPAATPVRVVHDAIAGAVHTTVARSLGTGVRGVGRALAVAPDRRGRPTRDRNVLDAVTPVVNGFWGDRLAAVDNPLGVAMTLRHEGHDLPPTPDALARAHPDATGHVVVFVHGLLGSDEAWWRGSGTADDDLPTHGHRLRRDLGATPVWLRYNSGRRVPESGRDLDELVERLEAAWPVPVASVSLVGHSMGGLVARSAVGLAADRGAAWVDRVAHVVCLGSPHHGAPLEKAAELAARALGVAPESRPFAEFLRRRSVGIKDLRFGSLHDEDARDRDAIVRSRDTRSDPGFVDGVAHHAIGVSLPGAVGHVVGDGLVRPASATGRRRGGAMPFDTAVEVDEPLHHLDLLDHPAVYEHLHRAMSGWAVT